MMDEHGKYGFVKTMTIVNNFIYEIDLERFRIC